MKKSNLFFIAVVINVAFSFCNAQTYFYKHFGDSTGSDRGTHFTELDDGGFLLTGNLSGYGAGVNYKHEGLFLMKTDSLGNTLWWVKHLGSVTIHNAYCFELPNKDIFVMAYGISHWRSPTIYTCKFDSTGNLLASGFLENKPNDYFRSFYALQTDDGGFFAAASYDDTLKSALPIIPNYIVFVKFDMWGNLAWTKKMTLPLYHRIRDFVEVNNNKFIITGYRYFPNFSFIINGIILEVDSNANALNYFYSPTIESSNTNTLIQYDNKYYISGSSTSFTNDGYTHGYIMQTDTNYNIKWLKRENMQQDYAYYNVMSIVDNNLIVSNSSPGTIIMDTLGQLLKHRYFATTGWNHWINYQRECKDGGFAFIGDEGWDRSVSFYKSGKDLEHTCNTYIQPPYLMLSDSINFITDSLPTVSSFTLYSTPFDSIVNTPYYFDTLFCSTVASIENELDKSEQLLLYPNPAQENIFITLPSRFNKGSFEFTVYNSMGEVIIYSNGNQVLHEINIQSLPQGIYLVACLDSKMNIKLYSKFIKN